MPIKFIPPYKNNNEVQQIIKILVQSSVCLLLNVFLFLSCTSSKIVSANKLKLMHDFCVEPAIIKYDTTQLYWSTIDSVLRNEFLSDGRLSEQDVMMAHATKSFSVINNILKYHADSSQQGQLLFYKYNAQLQQLLLPLRTEVESIALELDCEAARVLQLSSYLDGLNSKRNTKLTAASIVAGAATTLIPFVVKSNRPQNAIVIGSAFIAAGLGILTLHPGGKEVKLMHTRNLLKDSWFLPIKSTYYSAALWYILSEPKLSNNGQLSKAKIVKERWLKFELDNTIDINAEQLLFKDGGIYNGDNLRLRVTMLNELQIAIKSVNLNLANFIFNVNKITMQTN